MKIVFNVKEDDPRNPGVIADCTGDNAGDSVGPTADGFETYGVTGVALIAFITLAVPRAVDIQAKLIVWIFAMRFLMDFMSGVSYFINQAISEKQVQGPEGVRLRAAADPAHLDRVHPVHLDLVRHELAADQRPGGGRQGHARTSGGSWPSIISCGTLAAVLIPEFTKIFTSSHSKHVHEIVTASREGGASLTILSGLVAGNFSAFWMGMLIAGLMGGRLLRQPSWAWIDVMTVQLDPDHAAHRRRLDLRLRPGRVRLPVHGAGQHRRRQLRPGDRQRPVGLRAGPDRAHPRHQGRDPARLRLRAGLRARQALPGSERLGRQHLQGDRQAGADRHGRRRRHDDDLLDHPAAGQGRAAAPEPDRRPGAARLHLRRGRGLLVLRRLDAGRHHRRLPGRRVHQEEHGPRQERGRHRGLEDGRPHLHANTPRAACGTSSSP